MAKHTHFLLLPALLCLPLPPLLRAVPWESSTTPPSPAAGIRGDAEVSEDHSVPHESNSPHPLNRILQSGGRSHWRTPPTWSRRLLQTGSAPYPPLSVSPGGRTCILFRARKLAVSYRNHTAVDLTERAFGPAASVDTTDSTCSRDRAVLSLNFGDVENLKGLVIRLEMSNIFYESTEQTWFTLDSVQILYHRQLQATFHAPEIYAPATHSYHCQRVSSVQKYDSLLLPSEGGHGKGGPGEEGHRRTSPNWHITFTDFQIQAFKVQGERFSSARDCASLLTPAVLMGLVTSLILLLVLAYALHMVVHLKHIDRYEEHKTTVYFPRNPDADRTDKTGS
ncbi:ATPase H+ transporting accessory protein 1 like b [Anguilla anguilla]|uniref:ATPase H+ transporting accessory protein 1 like b n=1 Tax=Anguilla anguilla TaxID=7936 RepID=UPI0015A8A8AF|nr:ATPase H+ transporting accessory protein 1 like b [Anguilla anguilla]